MDLAINDPPERLMTAGELAAWREIPTAAICDSLDEVTGLQSSEADFRSAKAGLCAEIKPLAPGMRFAGQALTVKTVPGSNAAIHYGMASIWPGAALIVDAGGRMDCAVWGGVLNASAEAKDGGAIWVFRGLAPGRYAVAVYHDENGNGEFDQGFFGIPLEGYAFSNGATAFFSAPGFDEAAVTVGEGVTEITIEMTY